MDENHDRGVAGSDRRDVVVVPHRPGPLVSLDTSRSQRGRDDLDELIDDLFPEVDDGPGWFDGVLAALGAGLLAWAWIGDPPAAVTVFGIVALALGCILPIRAAWRRARQRRDHRRRQGLLDQGLPMDVSSPATAALVSAYETLVGLAERPGPEVGEPAIAAAHGALLEVASLLGGRSPTSESELRYVDERAAAVAELVGALGELPTGSAAPADDAWTVDPEALIAAREELDQIARYNSVTRLEELITEARIQHHGRD